MIFLKLQSYWKREASLIVRRKKRNPSNVAAGSDPAAIVKFSPVNLTQNEPVQRPHGLIGRNLSTFIKQFATVLNYEKSSTLCGPDLLKEILESPTFNFP